MKQALMFSEVRHSYGIGTQRAPGAASAGIREWVRAELVIQYRDLGAREQGARAIWVHIDVAAWVGMLM